MRWLLNGLAVLFVLMNGTALLIVSPFPEYNFQIIVALSIWLGCVLVCEFVYGFYVERGDPYFFPIVLLLLGWGILLVSRLAPNFLIRQVVWTVFALVIILTVSILPSDLRYLRRYPYTFMSAGIMLLLFTILFGVAPTGFGPRLWLKIPFVNVFFQPSEILKMIFIIFLAGFFAQQEQLRQFSDSKKIFGIEAGYLGPALLVWGFCMLLLVWQQDLGAAALFFFSFIALLYLATGEIAALAGGLGLMLLGGIAGYFLFDRVALRIEAWVYPWPDATDRAFQIVQSLYAIGAGNLIGSGAGQGFPIYIPVVHSDFALAAIAEEWGLIGSFAILFLFMVIAWRGFKIVQTAKFAFFRYLAAGITIFIAIQSLMIIGGVAKLLPLTGVTLPFVSYGGSSIVVSSLMIGIMIWLSNASTAREFVSKSS